MKPITYIDNRAQNFAVSDCNEKAACLMEIYVVYIGRNHTKVELI